MRTAFYTGDLSSAFALLMKNVTLPSTSNSSAASPSIASSSSVINALPLYFANCFRAPDRICSTCSPFPLVTLYQSKYLKCAIKVMANAADMLLTCVMNAGLITKLRELCPLPCGLFCCSVAPEIVFTALVTFRVTPGTH